MSYSGTGHEKAVPAGDLDRTHVGLTVSFEPDGFTLVFGRIGAIARKDASVTIALKGVEGAGSLQSQYSLPPTQTVYVQPDLLTNTESTLKDLYGKMQENLRSSKGGQRTDGA
ncbi:MAG: hypothetical protein ABWX85_08215 [Arthrobacter sp.]